MVNQIIAILDYLFGFTPSSIFPLQIVVWVLIGIGLISAIGVIIRMKSAHDKLLNKHLREYPGKLITISVLLLINLFSRLNRVEVLSMRFITFVLALWLLFSFYELYRDYFVFYPKERAAKQH